MKPLGDDRRARFVSDLERKEQATRGRANQAAAKEIEAQASESTTEPSARDGAPATAPRIDSGDAVVFSIPLRTGMGLNSREHWRARAKRVKAERMITSLAARTHRLLDCRKGLVVVTLVRISPGTRPMDSDNVPGSMKAVRDQLAAEMLIDDADPRVEWRYAQRRGKRHEVEVEMRPGPA